MVYGDSMTNTTATSRLIPSRGRRPFSTITDHISDVGTVTVYGVYTPLRFGWHADALARCAGETVGGDRTRCLSRWSAVRWAATFAVDVADGIEARDR